MSKNDDHDIDDVKSNFLATVSHEMRTPMQSIHGFLELIEMEETSDHVKEMVKIAKGSASDLLEILDDVLEFSKMDAGKMELDEFEIPLRTLVLGVFEALSLKVKDRPIELCDKFEDDVPAVVKGDPKRLRQILINLVGNALKFTEEGQIRIAVSTVSKKPLRIRFEVSDTGIGMSEEACARLFTPFNQADNSTSRKYGGTGLGLSICKKLVELMDGEIGVNSKEDEGSTFWFEIPTQMVDVDTLDMNVPDLTGLSILSVEDHPKGAKEIMNSLSSMGATVENCPTIKEALELVQQRRFDIGVIDQGLPDGEGLSLVRQIIDIQPLMGCLMYTARDDTGLRNSLQTLGVGYVSKPASRRGLGEAILDASSKISRKDNSGANKRLLIADDTDSVRDLIKRQLDTLGVDADIVEDGKQVLEALEKEDYGLLITDLHMPELDGYGVIEKIRGDEKTSENKRLPVIVLTADVQMADRQEYAQYGFDECLLKPVTLGHFKRLLIRWGMLKNVVIGKEGKNEKESLPKGNTPIDLNALEQQLGSVDGMAIEMLSMFSEMTQPLMDDLLKEAKEGDITKIREIAHSLKGGARSAGAMKMGDIAFEVQEQAEKNQFDISLIEQIEKEFESVKQHISELKSEYQG